MPIRGVSVFDLITCDDLIMAFFPCIHFCDAKTLLFRGVHIAQKAWSLKKIMDTNIYNEKVRSEYYCNLLKLVSICDNYKYRLVIENPWNTSRQTYLQCNFIEPSLIDNNRALRGDYFVKPTAYWFINCEPTHGTTIIPNKDVKIVYKQKDPNYTKGVCSEERSMISPDYARNFICDFIIGKPQNNTQLNLFD